MSVINKIGSFFTKYMAIIVLAIAALALFVPQSSTWISTKSINYLLMVIMFGMGLTIKPKDFLIIFKKPKEIIIGTLAQFTIMPILAFLLTKIFRLSPELAVGVILVGTCPGGSASNVITYFSKGDVTLSVGMTTINTLLAPLLTPGITYLLLQETISVDVLDMFLNILLVVVIPISLGLLINTFFFKFTQKAVSTLPIISTIAICLIIACVVSHNHNQIFECGAIVLVVVIIHNLLGFILGFLLGLLFRTTPEKTKALSIEVGMQNSGLATTLAKTSFPDLTLATVPGAIFSVWHNISGALLSAVYRRWKNSDERNNQNEQDEINNSDENQNEKN